MTIKRVCSKCKKVLGEVEGDFKDGDVTHGLCLPCLKIMSPEFYPEIKHEEAMRRGLKLCGGGIVRTLATPLRKF